MINKVFGTGGIGKGVIFALQDNQPLARNESRLGVLTKYQDYCKAHIILHYIAKLTRGVAVFAIGMVGRDESGESLLSQMLRTGIDTRLVGVTDQAPTMFSVCFQYPDGEGGNITTSNSACNLVTPALVEQCERLMDACSLVVAAPEVPLQSRIRLLEIGRKKKAFTVSSFLAGEARAFEAAGGFALSDLIAINRGEAEAVSGGGMDEAVKRITAANPAAKLIITDGARGSYVFDNGVRHFIPSLPATVVSTAGAGDAFLGGTIAGLISGRTFVQAAEYGAVIAHYAVQSADSIAQEVTLERVNAYIGGMDHGVSAQVCAKD